MRINVLIPKKSIDSSRFINTVLVLRKNATRKSLLPRKYLSFGNFTSTTFVFIIHGSNLSVCHNAAKRISYQLKPFLSLITIFSYFKIGSLYIYIYIYELLWGRHKGLIILYQVTLCLPGVEPVQVEPSRICIASHSLYISRLAITHLAWHRLANFASPARRSC